MDPPHPGGDSAGDGASPGENGAVRSECDSVERNESSGPGNEPTAVELRTFREVVRSAGHSIYWTDTSGTIQYVNASFEEQTGYSADEAVGSNASLLQSGVHDQQFYERLWDTILSGEVWNGEIINERRNGERYVVKQTISSVTNSEGTIVRFVAINEDITELRASWERAEKERDRFERLLDAVPVPIVLSEFSDGEPLVEQTNSAFREQFGFDEQLLAGSSLDEYIVDEDGTDIANEINERIREGERVHREVVRRTASGECRTFLLVATHLASDDRDEALGAYLDITDRKRAEEQLRRTNRHLEGFAEVVSHDLRNPLNTAIGHLEMIEPESDDDPHVEAVANAHTRMEDLITNVLSLAKRGQVIDETESVDLDAFVSDCWKTVATRSVTLRNEASGTVRADPARLRQLFGNLFRNSVEHGGVNATVTVDDLPDGFYVEDDGPGIPDDERDDAFESGHTTAEDGTGFGLAIVERIVEAHGWTVSVTEGEAGGARFEFTGVDRD
ncbi:PAS domain S-box protein [Halorubrum rubrum]|uniref:histidine kinase n=1 Tax=Halorubrum rubrum TaxID=1126240 RepID=A0ABD5R1M0_9EURY|nr:PAS domain S-box protein [Halorubrum rubrum]